MRGPHEYLGRRELTHNPGLESELPETARAAVRGSKAKAIAGCDFEGRMSSFGL